MALAAFDTLKFANRLKSVGIPLAQAEAEAEVLAEIFEVNLRDLATKDDLQREIAGLRKDVHREIGDLRKDMDAKHELLRKDMGVMEQRFDARLDKLLLQLTNRLGGIVVAGVVVIAALPAISKYLHLAS